MRQGEVKWLIYRFAVGKWNYRIWKCTPYLLIYCSRWKNLHRKWILSTLEKILILTHSFSECIWGWACQYNFIAKNMIFKMQERKHTGIVFCKGKKKYFELLFHFPVFKGSTLNEKPHSVSPAFACFWC